MKIINHFALLLLFGCAVSCTQPENSISNESIGIIPLPSTYELKPGTFYITGQSSIGIDKSDPEMTALANYFNEEISDATGFSLPVNNSGTIIFQLGEHKELGEEGYQLSISADQLILSAYKHHGIFNGIQSVLQLLPPEIKSKTVQADATWSINCIEVTDKPQFAWRGLMLDVSRHFFTKQEVKKFIDQMAEYKYNVFHWHLTDDQGWRLEVKSLPRLTAIGAWRAPRVGNWWEREPQLPTDSLSYGGYYTTEDIREIVEYAQQRYVTIVPEIDIPGHSMAALSAYPEISCTGGPFHVNVGNTFYTKIENSLCAGNEQTFEVLDSVFAEVARLFPSPYIHIGGDECYKGFWEKCPKCKMRMQKEHLKNLEELQSYFVKRVAAMVQKRGKQVIGWDEILEGGLAPEAIVMSWRGMKGGIEAAKQGHSVIMTPTDHCYLDFYQGDPTVEPNTYSMLRLQDCYKYQLIPDSVDASLIMGGQGNLWTESVPHYRQVEYMIWPRALAISETLWTDARLRNWKFFVNRVEQQFERFDRSGVNYARSIYDPIIYPHWDKERQLKIAMKTEIEGLSLFYTFDNTIPDIYSNMYTDTLSIPQNASMLRVAAYKGQEQAGRLIDITIDALKKRAAEGEKK
ncbi:family 20 glycosylhydrolase [Bacteroides salyersiae]|uniref:beta-N-acetylhexosaminidase n=1 Tax=Bacteroides salyersiae TaxID=291644 RepID=UPI00125D06F5|nr:family 20 glycosylhydrolase [Bacteroides salyersiae]KAB5348923.1 family 20 glycosylhydrolase [Bacteroides salyersiae]KAB5352121.1 family 20 glycosylhydrolase [Bacteroides salyersiae]KAB5356824.1 family 20 glycosylhydrolase [Bacteroides salyersiae]KAB5368499.1 family 20 glycosylhydrolase [Bacteroides salyersiae]KAB5376089.1 family 20 glycosylhydrolase [Bacteroides salyersiae]